MADFNVRSDTVDVEQIMRQIRARIREKRGVDYTEEEIRELANVKLEKFLDPRGVRSDLLEQFRRRTRRRRRRRTMRSRTRRSSSRIAARPGVHAPAAEADSQAVLQPEPADPGAAHPVEAERRASQAALELDALYYEVMHNLVLEMTRLGIEVKNLKMRVESMSSRLDFDERRARALEGVVQYRPGAVRAAAAAAAARPSHADRHAAPRPSRPSGGTGGAAGAAAGAWRAAAGGVGPDSSPAAGRRATTPARPGRRRRRLLPATGNADCRQSEPTPTRAAARTRRRRRHRRSRTTARNREARGRRSALRRRHQRRRRAARALHRRAARAPRRGRGPDDLRARLRHLAERAAGRRRAASTASRSGDFPSRTSAIRTTSAGARDTCSTRRIRSPTSSPGSTAKGRRAPR